MSRVDPRRALPHITYRTSPKLIAKKLGVSEEEALELCRKLEKEGLVEVVWEVTCPRCHSDVLIVGSPEEVEKLGTITCGVCGYTFSPREEGYLWVVCNPKQKK